MTKVNRVASVPLILSDPYFSIWSPADYLYETDTESWTGKKMPIRGYIKIDSQVYRFMGEDNAVPVIPQTNLEVTATQTIYTFRNELVELKLCFSTNLDLKNLQKVSEPVTVVTTSISNVSPEAKIELFWKFHESICQDSSSKISGKVNWNTITTIEETIGWMGKARQSPLNSTGDLIDIDWGYLYVALQSEKHAIVQKKDEYLEVSYLITDAVSFLVAYDDIFSINYFGQARTALWKEKYETMYQLLREYLNEIKQNLLDCTKLDEEIAQMSLLYGSETVEFLSSMSYRQAICAHKLIRDENGEIIFLSKECSSNGCIGTVDISYPSIPLFLIFQPELVKGMMRPIYRFFEMAVWEFDYAPHDVGRYPYVTGQVYAENRLNDHDGSYRGPYDTVFDIFSLPSGQNIYTEEFQMPIEETGNMLIMASTVFLLTKDTAFFSRYLEVNKGWAEYLLKYGVDPENQLCTDDFAGHLAHNSNLSLKAIVALSIFGKALNEFSEGAGIVYQDAAKEMATNWEKNAVEEKFTRLAFDQPNTWSLKYNIVWDRLFDLELFNHSVIEKELTHYLTQKNRFGVPLDNRESYTKADWTVWISTLTDDKFMSEQFLKPIRDYLENTNSRVPFSDWYDTKSGLMMNFKNRSVVGAIFMPHLKGLLNDQKI